MFLLDNQGEESYDSSDIDSRLLPLVQRAKAHYELWIKANTRYGVLPKALQDDHVWITIASVCQSAGVSPEDIVDSMMKNRSPSQQARLLPVTWLKSEKRVVEAARSCRRQDTDGNGISDTFVYYADIIKMNLNKLSCEERFQKRSAVSCLRMDIYPMDSYMKYIIACILDYDDVQKMYYAEMQDMLAGNPDLFRCIPDLEKHYNCKIPV